MSEPIPESIPTSQDPRSKRPTKRRALTPTSAQASQLEALFANPDREIRLPPPAAAVKPKGVAPPPEIVANVQGSSAGAGSGEFHVYKASRRREYERLRLMEEEVTREKETEEFERKKEENRMRDEERTRKNKARREKAKERKQKGKKCGAGKEKGDDEDGGSGMDIDRAKPTVGENGKAVDLKDGRKVSREEENAEAEAPGNPDEIGVIIHDDD